MEEMFDIENYVHTTYKMQKCDKTIKISYQKCEKVAKISCKNVIE